MQHGRLAVVASILTFSLHGKKFARGSGGQESYPLRIFTLGRSGRWTAAGRSSAGRQTADGRSSDGRPAGRPGGARVVSGAEKKII